MIKLIVSDVDGTLVEDGSADINLSHPAVRRDRQQRSRSWQIISHRQREL